MDGWMDGWMDGHNDPGQNARTKCLLGRMPPPKKKKKKEPADRE